MNLGSETYPGRQSIACLDRSHYLAIEANYKKYFLNNLAKLFFQANVCVLGWGVQDLGRAPGPEWVSLVSPEAWTIRVRQGALPEPRLKQRCIHCMEVRGGQGWLVCWYGASRIGIQEFEKRGWGVSRGTG